MDICAVSGHVAALPRSPAGAFSGGCSRSPTGAYSIDHHMPGPPMSLLRFSIAVSISQDERKIHAALSDSPLLSQLIKMKERYMKNWESPLCNPLCKSHGPLK